MDSNATITPHKRRGSTDTRTATARGILSPIAPAGLRRRRGSTPIEAVNPRCGMLSPRAYRVAKRLLDLTIVALMLPVLLPVFLLCALAIKVESPGGPVMFFQLRTGKGGKRFRMYKFRSMVPNAEAMKKELMHLNELQWPDFKITNDPRVTRVGRFLRKTSLDELPQLLNVITGDMSLVGPRPTSFGANTYALWQTERLDVIPGITGWAQANGWRGETDTHEKLQGRVACDLWYIDNWSLFLDIRILVKTAFAVLRRANAY